jgi:c-di-GMP-binding flagellar brake protein YcgR
MSELRSLNDRAADLDALIRPLTVDNTIQERQYLRLRISLELRYAVRGRAAAKGRTRDIGGGGICFECDQSLAIDTAVSVRFQLPNTNMIEATARIVAAQFDKAKSAYVYHVCFSPISDRVVDSITSYIARRDMLW